LEALQPGLRLAPASVVLEFVQPESEQEQEYMLRAIQERALPGVASLELVLIQLPASPVPEPALALKRQAPPFLKAARWWNLIQVELFAALLWMVEFLSFLRKQSGRRYRRVA